MKDSEVRRLEMFIRVRTFGAAHKSAFPKDARGDELFTLIEEIISELEGLTATQASGKRAAKEGTKLKGAALTALREELEPISRTAQGMAITMPGLDDKFRLPRNGGVQVWLAAARSFARDAEPLKDEFIRRGLPASFLTDLNAAIEALENAIDGRAEKTGARVAATVAIDAAIERGVNAVRELDAIVRNVFRNDAAVLAEWTSASHVERAPRQRTNAHAPTPAAPSA